MSTLFQSLALSGATNITVFMAAVFNLILAVIIYIHGNRTGNEIFYALIAFFITVWTGATLVTSGTPTLHLLIISAPLHYIAGQLAYFSFFWYAVFYLKNPSRSYWLLVFIIIINIIASALVIIPSYFFQNLSPAILLQNRLVFNMTGHLFYTLVLVITFFTTEVLLTEKHRTVENIDKKRLTNIIVGTTIGGSLGMLSNVILPAMNIYYFFPFGPILVSIFFTGLSIYALLKYKLFNIKLVGTEILLFLMWLVILTRTLFAQTLQERVINGGLLVTTVVIGIFLIRSVIKEVHLREKIQKLADELQTANDGQASLMHFMNHQIKGRFGNTKNIFAELLTGDYGEMPLDAKPLLEKGLDEATTGINYVQGILKGASAESGKLPYEMKPFDFQPIVEKVSEKQKEHAEKKGLTLSLTVNPGTYIVNGDELQLGEAISNLIDNSINYTLEGSIAITLTTNDMFVLLSVRDTGVGIIPEDRAKVFKAGGRGVNSLKVNTNSTGFGLAFVKGVVEAHKGKVWFESAGQDRGSTFYLELPKQNSQI